MLKVSTLVIFTVLNGTAMASTLVPPTKFSTDTQIIARNGADDPAGDQKGRGNDGVGHASLDNSDILIQTARNGADDPAGDHKGRGNDGVGHA
jgi:hypothetical protein